MHLNFFFKCIAEWTQNEAEENKAEAKVGIRQGEWTPKLAFTLRGEIRKTLNLHIWPMTLPGSRGMGRKGNSLKVIIWGKQNVGDKEAHRWEEKIIDYSSQNIAANA